jgi:hypothetical protein
VLTRGKIVLSYPQYGRPTLGALHSLQSFAGSLQVAAPADDAMEARYIVEEIALAANIENSLDAGQTVPVEPSVLGGDQW